MKQRNRKLSCLCIATALLAGANTTTVVAHESKDQVVEDMRSQSLSQRVAELLEETDCKLTRFALSPPAQSNE